MEQQKKTRNRSVRLTDDALECLRKSLNQRWVTGNNQAKLTRETRADMLGVSVLTADRILRGDPVDRSSLQIAFRSLGLDWSDSLVLARDVPDRIETTETIHSELTPEGGRHPVGTASIRSSLSSPASHTSIFAISCLAFIALAIGVGIAARKSNNIQAKNSSKQTTVNARILDIYDLFHRGHITEASSLLERFKGEINAFASAGAVAEGFRAQGDILEAKGELVAAKQCYECALQIRHVLRQPVCFAPLHEAIGAVETRQGDYSVARNSLKEALGYFMSTSDKVGIAMVERDLGALEFELRNYDEATSQYERALTALSGLDKPDLMVDVKAKLSIIHGLNGNYNMASSQLQNCLTYWRKKLHPRWIAVTQQQLGHVELIAGHRTTAGSYLRSSLDGFKSVGDKFGSALVTKELSLLDDN